MDFIIRQGEEKDLPAFKAWLTFNQCRIVENVLLISL